MAEVARGNGVDRVNTVHPASGEDCAVSPIVVGTDQCSPDVFVENEGVVTLGDTVEPHPYPSNCAIHSPGLVVGSGSIFVNGKPLGRKGDTYGCGAQIITGSSTVFAD